MERIPLLRFGRPYHSADLQQVLDYGQRPLTQVSLAVTALVQADITRHRSRSAGMLRDIPVCRILTWIRKAGRLFATAALQVDGMTQTPDDYCRSVMRATGLPLVSCREAVDELARKMDDIERIVECQCFGNNVDCLDTLTLTLGRKIHGRPPRCDGSTGPIPGFACTDQGTAR